MRCAPTCCLATPSRPKRSIATEIASWPVITTAVRPLAPSVLTASSAGACGFRGSKKGTAYAAQVAAERAAQAARQQYGFAKADVFIKGIGLGRDAAVRALSGTDIAVESIKDVTGVPHGGVRPRKARRI